MEKIYKSPFQNIEYCKIQKFLIQTWLKKTGKMTDKIFKKEMSELLNSLKEFDVEKLLINMTCFHFVVSPDLQLWVNDNVNKFINDKNIITAFVVSPDEFSRISVEQTLEESQGLDMNKNFFKNIDDAKKFLNVFLF